MGSEQDSGGDKNLEVIRQLLQKLEDAARRDVEERDLGASAPVPETSVLLPVEEPRRDLASLQRSQLLRTIPPEPPVPSPIVRRIDVEPAIEPNWSAALVVLPILAFVLGVASAAFVVASFDDIKRAFGLGAGLIMAKQEPRPKQVQAESKQASPSAREGSTSVASRAVPETIARGAGQVASSQGAFNVEAGLDRSRETGGGAAQGDATRPAVADRSAAPAKEASGPIAQVPLSAMIIVLPERFSVASGERTKFPLRLEPPAREADALLLVLRGVPDTMILTSGSGIGNDIWLLPAHTVDMVEFTVTEPSLRALHLDVEVVALDGQVVGRSVTNIEVSATVAAGGAPENLQLDDRAMVRLGEMLLDTGDLAGARAVLERAASGGSGLAAFRLAETFDPERLPGSGLQPAAADAVMAQRWYEKARELGNPTAAERLKEQSR